MIMPGRSWVAGIDIAGLHLLNFARNTGSGAGPGGPPHLGVNTSFYTGEEGSGNRRAAG